MRRRPQEVCDNQGDWAQGFPEIHFDSLERTGADALLPIRMAIYYPPPNRGDCPRYERCAGPKVPARQTGLTPQAERDTLEPDG